MSWRLLNFDRTPQEYFALREVLINETEDKRSPSTVTLFKPLKSFVLLCREGRLSEVNIDECQKRGIPIIRETAAGGVLLFTPSVLSICITIDIRKVPLTTDEANKLSMGAVIDVCESFGLEAKRSKHRQMSNDIVLGNRKVSGLVTKLYGNYVVVACMFTVGFDHDLASAVLKIPASKFADKPYDNMRGWVTSLRKELDRDISVEDVKKGFINALEDRYKITLREGKLTIEEEKALEKLSEKYSSESWLKYGKWSPVKDYWRPE